MLTIDLLKGRGIPPKSRPAGASLMAVLIAVPVIVTIVTFGNYVRGGIIIRNQKRVLTDIQADIFKLAEGIKFKQDAEREISNINACFVEVNDVILQQIQWSPIFEALAKNMPTNLILSELSVKSEIDSKNVPQRKNPLKMITIPVPRRILYISLYGRQAGSSDKAVLEFIKVLNASTPISERADSIRLIAQATDEKKDVMEYVIECVFKPL
jgi:hypothetical protein